jgi:hypothetical protein
VLEKHNMKLNEPSARNRKAKFVVAVAFLVVAFGVGYPRQTHAVPSFARQTGMACQACHTAFPELTPFGRSFKLNGYQIDNLPQVQGIASSTKYELLLNQVPPRSVMLQTSYTKTGNPLPDSAVPGAKAQDGQLLFPQQASLFYAGRVAPELGAFIQITYDSAAGIVHWDNSEIRYAKQVTGATNGLTWSITLNNNPTVQDVWNSTPAEILYRSPLRAREAEAHKLAIEDCASRHGPRGGKYLVEGIPQQDAR